MIDDRTPYRDYPLPYQNNRMRADDLPRLRQALTAIDGDVSALVAAGQTVARTAFAGDSEFLQLLSVAGYEEQ